MKNFFMLFLASLVIVGCSSYSKYTEVYSEDNIKPIFDIPEDFDTDEAKMVAIKNYSQYFAGKTIFIDPGHGGDDKVGRSKSGKVIEAEINLKVALFLRDYLEQAGADVEMSRTGDKTVSLKERSEMANESGADLFISVHHNSTSNPTNYRPNYTSTYYHATEGAYEYDPYESQIARYVQRDLAYIMRNSGGLGSFDGTYSDYVIYPDEGFAVLRETNIPSILVECSFYTNPFEEARLEIEYFNAIEAWGIFKGLGKFFSNNHPKIILDEKKSKLVLGSLNLTLNIETNEKIDESSIDILLDKKKINFAYNNFENKIIINETDITEGEHIINVTLKNMKGNYSIPFRKKLIVKFTD